MYYTSRDQDHAQSSITIRAAGPADAEALLRLAELDSKSVPAGELLVALVGDRLRAAVSPASGAAIADPFHPTEDLLGMLTARASQMRGAGHPAGRSSARRVDSVYA